jgi:hypothetical protein
MNAIDFACFFTRYQKSLDKHLDSDIVSYIYDEYCKTFYDKYTLFELISMLKERSIEIPCSLNKHEIIRYISENNIDIPDCGRYDKSHTLQWYVYELLYYNNICRNIIHIKDSYIQILRYYKFKLKDETFQITNITCNSVIVCNEEYEYKVYTIADFMRLFVDHEEDMTILTNHILDNKLLRIH